MHYNGSGTAVRDTNWQADAANSVPISAPEMDLEFDGVATCLTNCLTKDGQQTATNDIPMGAHKLTNLGSGTIATDAANYGQVIQAARFPNFLLNAGFRVWQRSNAASTVSGTAARIFGPDRWCAQRDGVSAAYSMTPTALTVTGLGSKVLQLQRTAADAGVSSLLLTQSIDPLDADFLGRQTSVSLANGKLAFSVYLRKGANFSATSVDIEIWSSATPAQNIFTGVGFSTIGSSVIAAASISAATYTRFSVYQTALAVAGGSLAVVIRMNTPSGVAGADDAVYIACPKFEFVDTTSNFTSSPYYEISLASEQPALERYFEKSFALDTTPADAVAPSYTVQGVEYAANTMAVSVQFRNRKRLLAAPTITVYRTNVGATTAGQPQYFSGGTWFGGSAVATIYNTETGFRLDFTTAGLTNNNSHVCAFNWTANAEF